MRGATFQNGRGVCAVTISIHAPRAGRDQCRLHAGCRNTYFNPRAPCGARPKIISFYNSRDIFQSTRPVRGATSRLFLNSKPFEISIHAPRAGRDPCVGSLEGVLWYFNPRAPCGARHTLTTRQWNESNFNPRAPCGARRTITSRLIACINFNPRAPCGARQSRPAKASSFQDFNPRAPCGARPLFGGSRRCLFLFQSTRPVRGATKPCYGQHRGIFAFQSTRPVRGATGLHRGCTRTRKDFNPRAPCGARRSLSGCLGHALFISIHAPRAGRDSARW